MVEKTKIAIKLDGKVSEQKMALPHRKEKGKATRKAEKDKETEEEARR